jgi:hypothetical protein
MNMTVPSCPKRLAAPRVTLVTPMVTLVALLITPAALAEEGVECTVRGKTIMRATTKLYPSAEGGVPFASFTGAEVSLAASDFPASGSGRARVVLGGFGLEGYVALDALTPFTTRPLAAPDKSVLIAEQRDVRIVGASDGKLHVAKSVLFPMEQTFNAKAPCDALTFTQAPAPGWSPPGDARGYVAKGPIEIFETPDGALATTLRPSSAGSGILFFSTERRGPWVNVAFHGDVIVDAWAKVASLRALPPGETMDQLYPPSIRRGRPMVKLATDARVVTTKDARLTLKAEPKVTAPNIGQVEPGTEIYLIDTVAGWASVMPKSLAVAPEGEGQFWVHAGELGL